MFVGHRADLTDTRMPPSTIIIDHPPINSQIQLGPCGECVTIVVFVFEGRPERFRARVSSPRELHPRALVEPCVNLSIYTAPIVEPEGLIPMAQCAKSSGSRRAMPTRKARARLGRRRNRLNLRQAQRTSRSLMRCRRGYNADL